MKPARNGYKRANAQVYIVLEKQNEARED